MKQNDKSYRLLDCGGKRKLEQFGEKLLIRPAPQAIWEPKKPEMWKLADSEFVRTGEEKGFWKNLKKTGSDPTFLTDGWEIINSSNIKWRIKPNEFGNLGVFTEHWVYIPELLEEFKKGAKILNLFTYTGSNCVELAKNGFKITAVDSSKVAMTEYVENLERNEISKDGGKLILEDVSKFMARESRRGSKYDVIMMDAPSYGRGTKGEVFKIEDDLTKLIYLAREILDKSGKLVITLHSPRFTPELLRILLEQIFPAKKVSVREILNHCESGLDLPSGMLAKVY